MILLLEKEQVFISKTVTINNEVYNISYETGYINAKI